MPRQFFLISIIRVFFRRRNETGSYRERTIVTWSEQDTAKSSNQQVSTLGELKKAVTLRSFWLINFCRSIFFCGKQAILHVLLLALHVVEALQRNFAGVSTSKF